MNDFNYHSHSDIFQRTANAALALGWGGLLTSMVEKILPWAQLVAAILAAFASLFAILVYNRTLRRGRPP